MLSKYISNFKNKQFHGLFSNNYPLPTITNSLHWCKLGHILNGTLFPMYCTTFGFSSARYIGNWVHFRFALSEYGSELNLYSSIPKYTRSLSPPSHSLFISLRTCVLTSFLNSNTEKSLIENNHFLFIYRY